MMGRVFRTIVEGDYGAGNVEVQRRDDEVHVTLQYPDLNSKKGGAQHVIVDQESVRASDTVRLTYDYARDGWIVAKPSISSWSVDDNVCDEGWKEVVFIPSWMFDEEMYPGGGVRALLPRSEETEE